MSSSSRIITSGTALVLCPKIKKLYGVSAALVLQQLHYWLSKENLSYGVIDEKGYQWIRNTYEQWCDQIQVLTLSTLRRAFSTLEKNNIILSQRFAEKSRYSGGNQVKFYTINYAQLEAVMGDLEKSFINKPSRFADNNSGAGDTIPETTPNDSKIVQQHQIQNHVENRLKQPTHLLKMNTLPAQNEQPLYITNTTSENTSKKTSLSEASQKLDTAQHHGVDFQTIQPDKPAERDKLIIVEEMLSLWNTIVEQTKNKICITPKRSQHLNAAFKQYFNSDLADWESFCCKIASSQFLMGDVKAFKANLDWSIRFETIQRILEGGYSFGDRVVSYTPRIKVSEENTGIDSATTCFHNEKHIHGNTKQESKEALVIRHHVRQILGDAIYNSWFENTDIILEKNECNDYKATIYVSSRFIADRLRTHYVDIIERYFNAIHVGEPPKTESVTYSEIMSTESVTPFVELPETENNVEIVSEYTPELSNQAILDINAQQKEPVDTYKGEFSQAEGVQHAPENVSVINDESHTIDCAINKKTVNPRSRLGGKPLANDDHKDRHRDVVNQGLLCELQENTQQSYDLKKPLDTRNLRHKLNDNTEKTKQRERSSEKRHLLKTPTQFENMLEGIRLIYASIRSMCFCSFGLYRKERRDVIRRHTTKMLAANKFLRGAIRLMYSKAAGFIDSTILDPPLSFYELKMKF
jgi:hypothetical protein